MSIDLRSLEAGPNFDRAVFEATVQIPKGMVSTYGAIAKALGDGAAARAVGMCLAADKVRPFTVPCHRVVYADGRVGWYTGKGQGSGRKVELLREEGVPIEEGKVDMERALFTDFRVRPILAEMRVEQEELRRKVISTGSGKGLRRLAAVDVAYTEEEGHAAMVMVDLESMRVVEEKVYRARAGFPYIPSYLSYRELPFLLPLVDGLKDTVVAVDGQGMAHPRRFGIACQLGVRAGVPTIGAAKSVLCGHVDQQGTLRDGDEILGRRVAGAGRSPYYISVGHKLALDDACDIVSRLLMAGVDPMRRAHQLASAAKAGTR
jgi:deoxyribonuclease V